MSSRRGTSGRRRRRDRRTLVMPTVLSKFSRSSSSLKQIDMPIPPPPPVALSMIGYPTRCACSSAASSVETSSEPGRTGTSAAIARARASCLRPMDAICSAVGPSQSKPAASTLAANSCRASTPSATAQVRLTRGGLGTHLVLGEEAVAGVDHGGARVAASLKDGVPAGGEGGGVSGCGPAFESAGRGSALVDVGWDEHGLVGLECVRRSGICVLVDGDGREVEVARRAQDAHGDLAAIGDEELVLARCHGRACGGGRGVEVGLEERGVGKAGGRGDGADEGVWWSRGSCTECVKGVGRAQTLPRPCWASEDEDQVVEVVVVSAARKRGRRKLAGLEVRLCPLDAHIRTQAQSCLRAIGLLSSEKVETRRARKGAGTAGQARRRQAFSWAQSSRAGTLSAWLEHLDERGPSGRPAVHLLRPAEADSAAQLEAHGPLVFRTLTRTALDSREKAKQDQRMVMYREESELSYAACDAPAPFLTSSIARRTAPATSTAPGKSPCTQIDTLVVPAGKLSSFRPDLDVQVPVSMRRRACAREAGGQPTSSGERGRERDAPACTHRRESLDRAARPSGARGGCPRRCTARRRTCTTARVSAPLEHLDKEVRQRRRTREGRTRHSGMNSAPSSSHASWCAVPGMPSMGTPYILASLAICRARSTSRAAMTYACPCGLMCESGRPSSLRNPTSAPVWYKRQLK